MALTALNRPDEIKPLAGRLRWSQRAAQVRALLLIAPLLIFLFFVFLVPVAMLLSRSVLDQEVAEALPRTVAALSDWDAAEQLSLPEQAFAALLRDLQNTKEPEAVAQAATRLNYSMPGMRSLLLSTRRKISDTPPEKAREALLAASPKWGEEQTWAVIQQAGRRFTDFYILTALDLKRNPNGSIAKVTDAQSAFVPAITRTFEIAFGVTVLALIFGFPFAYLITQVAPRAARLLIFFVLLPLWTAIMVRTLSWMVLLQREGLINEALLLFRVTGAPLELLYNRFAVYIALLHIFVPYMVLPLYSVMKTIPRNHLRAAASMGAPPFSVFYRIYLPQVGPGIGAGALLVFIQCLGVFVIPAILGGPTDQGIPYLIAFYVNRTLNWGMAGALSIILLISVYICYWLFAKLSRSTSLTVS